MQRLPKIEKENTSGDLTEFYGAVTGLLGRVPNFYRTISHAPWMAMLLLPFNAQDQGTGCHQDQPCKWLSLLLRA